MTAQEIIASGAAAIISGYFVMLMASSVYAKVSDFPKFEMIVAGYRMVPGFLIPGVAIAVTLLEFILAILLLILASQFFALVCTALLLLTYAIIAAIAIWRGDAGVPCGCGPDEQTVGWTLVVKNAALANISMWIANSLSGQNQDMVSMFLFTVLGFSIFLMERTVSQLAMNHSNGLKRTQTRTIT